ncbi:MAG: agmatine deiminase family protein [Myxococcota bacterium]
MHKFIFTILLTLSWSTHSLANPSSEPSSRPFLPAWETQSEKSKDNDELLWDFKYAHPELYGITEKPPAGMHLYAEFAPVDRLYLAFDSYISDYYLAIIEAAAQTVEVHVLCGEVDEAEEVGTLLDNNLATEIRSNVHVVDLYPTDHYVFQSPYYDSALDAIWTVDYGPFYLVNDQNEMVLTDPHYYFQRINDDSVPTKLGNINSVPVYRTDLEIEGGNLISDGAGNCYTTDVLFSNNSQLDQTQIEEKLNDYFGCTNVVWLQPLSGEGTGHIDMFFILADSDTVVLGEFTQSQDSQNAAILNQNAQVLENTVSGSGSPLTVLRIPMPDKGQEGGYAVWRTYTNGLRLNDRYLMPVYDDENSNQVEAVNVLQNALPSVQIIPIPSDTIITWGGAIHCITRSRPEAIPFVPAEDPDYLCGGDPVCDDCEDECAAEETGCLENGDRYVCGNNDSDSCLEIISLACPDDQPCSEGNCGNQDCLDECLPGEQGCSDDYTRWVCAEAGDGDSCLETIEFPCDSERSCFSDGVCLYSEGECGDIDYDGECQGDFSVYCDDGQLVVVDCSDYGQACAYVSSEGWYDCVEQLVCEDECVAGEIQCSDDQSSVQYCAETFDGDQCLEWKDEACADEMICEVGECVPVCEDQCVPEEVGCIDEVTAYTCELADNGCYEVVQQICPEKHECNEEGICTEIKSSDSGCSCNHNSQEKTIPAGLLFFLVLGVYIRKASTKFAL